MTMKNYTREELKQRRNQTAAVIVWALILLAVIVKLAVN